MVRKMKRKWFWRRQIALWDAAMTLAAWRWRTQRFLLFVTGLGITVAVILIASLPLFSSVMTTAGLRGVLRAQANSSQLLTRATLSGISSSLLASSSVQLDDPIQQDVGHYLVGRPQTTIITSSWSNISPLPADFYGVPIQTAQSHLKLLQGHLPPANTSSATSIDIMLTRTAALYMGHLKVGDTLTLTANLSGDPSGQSYTSAIQAHIVGIFQVQPNDAYWDGYTLEQPPPVANQKPPDVLALTDQASLLHMLDTISQQNQSQGIYFDAGGVNLLLLSYYLNVSTITSDQLADVITQMGILQHDYGQNFQDNLLYSSNSNISSAELSGPLVHDPQTGAASTLEKYQSQIQITQLPALILTAQVLCLILFFISVMIGALVEREQVAIAVMRSRGANRRQVSGSLITQGLALCVLAGLIGPLLALGLVYLLAPRLLTPATQDAFNALTLHPQATLRPLLLYTLAAVVAAFLTLLLTIFLAVQANILTQRREEARATRVPLWQRLRLDLVVAIVAIAGYVTTYYLESTREFLSAQAQILVSTPLELLAPLLLLLAGILFFLRFFPPLLGLLARMSQRRRGLTSMLALAQIERAPRQTMRMALLLGLASAFTLFSLVFSASQGQRAQDLATYQAVSDFSGYNYELPATTQLGSSSTRNIVQDNANAVLGQVTTQYRQIRGVTMASTGSVNSVYLLLNQGTSQATSWLTNLIAVDPATFAQTALWTPQDSSQPLADLMRALMAQRSQASQHGTVPAIVAANTWQQLGLSQGVTFHLTDDSGNIDPTIYVAIAEVNHIPPVDDGSEGAILVDYQSLVAGQLQARGIGRSTTITQLNYIWLRSGDDPTALQHIRAALNTPAFALDNLMDRHQLSGGNAADPLANGLITTMSIGVAATLLLAFLANLLLPLLSVRMRQTHFAVLRALGTDSGQVTGILTLELAIVLATSLVLGLLFGAVLAFTSVPPLVFTGALPASLISISSSTIYTLQKIIPVTVVIPLSLLVALVTLVLLCVLALGLMTRLAQRPLMAQALRLNED
jgi:ABC-type antimicrobial peptide transport system permease subunit